MKVAGCTADAVNAGPLAVEACSTLQQLIMYVGCPLACRLDCAHEWALHVMLARRWHASTANHSCPGIMSRIA